MYYLFNLLAVCVCFTLCPFADFDDIFNDENLD